MIPLHQSPSPVPHPTRQRSRLRTNFFKYWRTLTLITTVWTSSCERYCWSTRFRTYRRFQSLSRHWTVGLARWNTSQPCTADRWRRNTSSWKSRIGRLRWRRTSSFLIPCSPTIRRTCRGSWRGWPQQSQASCSWNGMQRRLLRNISPLIPWHSNPSRPSLTYKVRLLT